jgi:hypothetical protein
MGVDTKGVVATKCSDVFFVVHLAEEALNKLIRPQVRAALFAGRTAEKSSKNRTVSTRLLAESEGVQLSFAHEGEDRTLHMYFVSAHDDDDDDEDEGHPRILLSMGCWGKSELYMKTVLQALSPLGDVYFDYSDCDDVDKALLEAEPLTFVTACAAGIESDFPTRLSKWNKLFDAGLLRAGTREEVLGLPTAEIERLTSIHWETAHPELKAICAAAPVPPVPALVHDEDE